MWHNSAAGTDAASQLLGPRFDPELRSLWAFADHLHVFHMSALVSSSVGCQVSFPLPKMCL